MRRLILAAFVLGAAAVIGTGGAGSAKALTADSGQHWSVASTGGSGAHVVRTHGMVHHAAMSAHARRALQASGDKNFVCSPAFGMPVNNDTEQTCVIQDDNGTCIEKSDSPVVAQTCTFTQTTGDSDKHATAVQVAATDVGGSTQGHTQIIHVTQSSDGASNFVDASQTVKQSVGSGHFDDTDEGETESTETTSPMPITTNQDFHQIVTVDQQATTTGNNKSAIDQFGKQRARAKQVSPISQFQNTAGPSSELCPAEDANANQCSSVSQVSGTGTNTSNLKDTYLQFERAHKSTVGTQTQGRPGDGGIDHEIHQESLGYCEIQTTQTERQVMRAVQSSVAQNQHGPTRKGVGSNQDCNDQSKWTGGQDSRQVATSRPKETDIDSLVFASPANQTNLLEYFGVSSGAIHATQDVTEQNNAGKTSAHNSCPGAGGTAQVCGAEIFCVEGGCGPGEGAANPCGPGQFPDPMHPGRCTGD